MVDVCVSIVNGPARGELLLPQLGKPSLVYSGMIDIPVSILKHPARGELQEALALSKQ